MISKDEYNHLKLNEESLNLLKNIDGDIAVCSIAGSYRSGKSFLLNNIYKSLSGDQVSDNFKVGNGINGFTKGVWINPNIIPINVEDKIINILLFDTEVNI